MKVPFLQPAEAMVPVHKNSTEERSTTVFNLGSQPGNLTGGHKWYNPITDQIIVRSQYTEVPMANYHVALLQQRGDADKIKLDSVLDFRRGDLSSFPLYSFADAQVVEHADSSPPLETHEVRGILPPFDPVDSFTSLASNDVISTDIIPAEDSSSRQVPGGDAGRDDGKDGKDFDIRQSPDELVSAPDSHNSDQVQSTHFQLVDAKRPLDDSHRAIPTTNVEQSGVKVMEMSSKESGVKMDMSPGEESGVQHEATDSEPTRALCAADKELAMSLRQILLAIGNLHRRKGLQNPK